MFHFNTNITQLFMHSLEQQIENGKSLSEVLDVFEDEYIEDKKDILQVFERLQKSAIEENWEQVRTLAKDQLKQYKDHENFIPFLFKYCFSNFLTDKRSFVKDILRQKDVENDDWWGGPAKAYTFEKLLVENVVSELELSKSDIEELIKINDDYKDSFINYESFLIGSESYDYLKSLL